MPSLTYTLNIETLTKTPLEISLHATKEERGDIQNRLDLVSIENLEAKLHVKKKELIFLTGSIKTNFTQECVRTLVHFPQHLEINVNESFVFPAPQKELKSLSLEESEPLEDNILNIGEIVIQLLSLNLDPYPVAPDTGPLDYQEDKSTSSPFHILKKKE